MMAPEAAESCKLWIVTVAGERRALRHAPRRGSRVKVKVEKEALANGHIFLLCRKGQGDIIVAASAHAERLDEVLARLGHDYSVETARIEPA
jgi:tRNA(Ile2) C34 agmatinyltransferase TiaS